MRPHWVGSVIAVAVSASALAAPAPAGESTAVPGQPALEVSQRVAGAPTAGDGLAIDLTVANRGRGGAENVTVTDTPPEGYEYLAAEPPPERLRRQLIWALGPVGPGERRSLRLCLRPPGRGSPAAGAENRVEVSFAGTLVHTAAIDLPRPVLGVLVSGPEAAPAGRPLTLGIVVSNSGTARACSVSLTALLSGLSHPGGPDLENPLDDLAPGQSVTIPLVVTPTQAGEAHVRLRLTADGAAPAASEFTLRTQPPRPRFKLQARGPVRSDLGSPCRYEWTVHNNGAEAARGLRLVVYLADGVSFVRADGSGAYDAGRHALCWDLAEVPAGGSAVVTWEGSARKLGDQQCQGLLTGSAGAVEPVTCSTKVVPAPARTGE
jgi:uncharacterized repeat protein (TIGR01451 family)